MCSAVAACFVRALGVLLRSASASGGVYRPAAWLSSWLAPASHLTHSPLPPYILNVARFPSASLPLRTPLYAAAAHRSSLPPSSPKERKWFSLSLRAPLFSSLLSSARRPLTQSAPLLFFRVGGSACLWRLPAQHHTRVHLHTAVVVHRRTHALAAAVASPPPLVLARTASCHARQPCLLNPRLWAPPTRICRARVCPATVLTGTNLLRLLVRSGLLTCRKVSTRRCPGRMGTS